MRQRFILKLYRLSQIIQQLPVFFLAGMVGSWYKFALDRKPQFRQCILHSVHIHRHDLLLRLISNRLTNRAWNLEGKEMALFWWNGAWPFLKSTPWPYFPQNFQRSARGRITAAELFFHVMQWCGPFQQIWKIPPYGFLKIFSMAPSQRVASAWKPRTISRVAASD